MASAEGIHSVAGDRVHGCIETKCELCLRKGNTNIPAKVFCRDCELYMCKKCKNGHKRDKINAKHNVLDIKDAKLDKDFRQKKASSSQEVLRELERIKNEAEAVKQSITKNIANVTNQCDALPMTIEQLRKTLNYELDKLKDSMTLKSEISKKNYLQSMDVKYSACDSIEKATIHLIDTGVSISSTALEAQIQPFKTLLHQQQSDLHTLDFSIEFEPTLTSLLHTGRPLGRLQIDKRDDVDAAPVKPVTLTLVTSVNLQKTDDDQKEPFYSGLAFLPGGRLVAMDNANGKLYAMNENLDKLGEYTFRGTSPYSVAVFSTDRILATYGRTFLILQISSTNALSLIHTIKFTSKYCSIYLKDESPTFVASTWEDKRPVRMINMRGEEMDFPDLPENEYKRDASACAYVQKTDTLILTDRFKHTVFMYDTKDSSMTRRAVKDENIREPMGVCEGPDGTVFVCSQSTNMIVQVSPAGRVIGAYKLNMKYPLAICTSQDSAKLAVSNRKVGDKRLQFFSIV